MTAPHFKLIYFPAMGRGETSRYLFHVAEVEFEEETIQMGEWHGGKKSEFPLGGLPVLEVTDGEGTHRIAQTLAINRYLAKRFGLAGRNVLEQAQADMVVDSINGLWGHIGPFVMCVFGGKDQAEKTAAANEFIESHLKPMLTKLTTVLDSNKHGGGKFFVGDKVTWADIAVAEWCGRMTRVMDEHCLDDHPQIKQLVQMVESIPQIQKRIATRPTTPL